MGATVKRFFGDLCDMIVTVAKAKQECGSADCLEPAIYRVAIPRKDGPAGSPYLVKYLCEHCKEVAKDRLLGSPQ